MGAVETFDGNVEGHVRVAKSLKGWEKLRVLIEGRYLLSRANAGEHLLQLVSILGRQLVLESVGCDAQSLEELYRGLRIELYLSFVDLGYQAFGKVLEPWVLLVETALQDCQEDLFMIGLIPKTLLEEAKIARDGTLDEFFFSNLSNKFVSLAYVKMCDGLEEWNEDSLEGHLIVFI